MSGEIFIETVKARSFDLPVSEHLYLVFRDINGAEFVLRAGPSSPTWPFGELKVEVNVPIHDSADDRDGDSPGQRSSRPLDFPDLTDDQAWAIMVKYARMIESADYGYGLVTENSNAFIGALLQAAGGTPEKMLPTGIRSSDAIGFSSRDNILDDIAPPKDGIFYGTGGADLITGLQIDEDIRSAAGNDVVNAGRGNDIVRGGAGNDTLNGEYGDDRLFGESGADTLRGGDGNDLLDGGADNDFLDGGAGMDWALFAGSVAVTVNLGLTGAQNTGLGLDTLRGIENVASGSGNDLLTGNTAANALSGGAGNDILRGSGGNDLLNGGAGDDRLFGESGADTLRGGDGNDLLDGGVGNDILDGGAGTDWALFAGPVTVTVNLGLTGAQNTGLGLDTLLGIENVAYGAGNDLLIGNGHANALSGNAGNDVLGGGGGNDVLNGGPGSDTMSGGVGADRFVFANCVAGDIDTVLDFVPGTDRLQFSGMSDPYGFTLSEGISGGNTFTELEWDMYRVRLEGVEAAMLTEDAFIFV